MFFFLYFLLLQGDADMVHPVNNCAMNFTMACTSVIVRMVTFFIKTDTVAPVSNFNIFIFTD